MGYLGGREVANGLVVFSTPDKDKGDAVVGRLVKVSLGLTFDVDTADHPPENARHGKIRCFFLAPRRFHGHVTTKSFLRCRRMCGSHFCKALGTRIRGRLRTKRGIIFSISMRKKYHVGRCCNRHTLDMFVRPPSMRRLHHQLRNHKASTPRVVGSHVTHTRCRLAFTSGFSAIMVGSGLRRTRIRTCGGLGSFLGGWPVGPVSGDGVQGGLRADTFLDKLYVVILVAYLLLR